MPNSYAVVTLFGVDGLLLFLMVFHNKSMVRSSYMMITMFIICYRDPMCQIHTQWGHFSALMGFTVVLMMFHHKSMVRSSLIIISLKRDVLPLIKQTDSFWA